MAKTRRKDTRDAAQPVSPQANLGRWLPVVAILIVAIVAAVVILAVRASRTSSSSKALPAPAAPPPSPAPAVIPAPTTSPGSEVVTMDVAKAVMVTVELDFGGK